MTVCVSDPVCNRYLAPVLTACTEQQCDRDRCQEVTQQFYGSMPHNVAEMLVMCECEALDQSCLDMKTALHRGTCGQQTRICQDTVNQCVEDSHCRYVVILSDLCLALHNTEKEMTWCHGSILHPRMIIKPLYLLYYEINEAVLWAKC